MECEECAKRTKREEFLEDWHRMGKDLLEHHRGNEALYIVSGVLRGDLEYHRPSQEPPKPVV